MDVTLARKMEHKELMLKVSHDLSKADFNDLKYWCDDIIAEAALEKVTCATRLFTLLQYHGLLGPGCYNFMSKALSSIGRKDLASLLPQDEKLIEYYKFDGLSSECVLKHRLALVAVAKRLRKEDIHNLLFVTSGKVKSAEVTDDAISSLQVLAGLEESSLLCCFNLCDLLQQIGRRDLADLVTGFPSGVPQAFTMHNQAFALMLEVLRNKRKLYLFHLQKLSQMKDGNHKIVQEIHSMLLSICEQHLSSRNPESSCTSSAVKSLQHAFDSQYQFLQCILVEHSDGRPLKHMEIFNFVNDAFGRIIDHKNMETLVCPLADSAHQTRMFILEVSCEVIGKEKVTKVHQLNEKIEKGINICSGYARHVSSVLSCLAGLLSSVAEKRVTIDSYQMDLMDIFKRNKNYLMGTFPKLAPRIQSVERLDDLSKISQTELSQLTTNLDDTLMGLVTMVAVPCYTILLNLLCSSHGQANANEVLQNLVDYLRLPSHIAGAKEFVERCATALDNHVASFQHDIIELDELCAPLITELINPSKHLL